jgi:hypothetical protein
MGRQGPLFNSADEQYEVDANFSEVAGAGWTTSLEENTEVVLARCQCASVIRQYNDHISCSLRCDGLIWNVHSSRRYSERFTENEHHEEKRGRSPDHLWFGLHEIPPVGPR